VREKVSELEIKRLPPLSALGLDLNTFGTVNNVFGTVKSTFGTVKSTFGTGKYIFGTVIKTQNLRIDCIDRTRSTTFLFSQISLA
jgi:rRNA processing protein Gar1